VIYNPYRWGTKYNAIMYFKKGIDISNKLSHTEDPNIMRLRCKSYLTVAQFLNKEGHYNLAELYAFKCLDICSVELSTRFSGISK
jgi:hypothetical protein